MYLYIRFSSFIDHTYFAIFLVLAYGPVHGKVGGTYRSTVYLTVNVVWTSLLTAYRTGLDLGTVPIIV